MNSSKSLRICIINVILFGLYLISETAIIDYTNPVAQTAYGQIRGKPYTYASTGTGASRQVVAFIGVPYARPPTGYDRFLVSLNSIISYNNYISYIFINYLFNIY